MEDKPKISIVIPSAPARDFSEIVSNLEKIKPADTVMQIIIVKGTWPPTQRNVAIKKADGKYIFLFDDDVIIPKGSIEKAMEILDKDQHADIVGGPNLTPKSNGFLQHCFGLAHASYFTGAFTSARYWPAKTLNKCPEKTCAEHLISCNLAFRSEVLKNNHFATDIFPNEENELLNRLQKKGFKLRYNTDFFVYHHRRKTLPKYIKQIFAWGKGRAIHTTAHPKNFNPAFFAPLLFLIYLIGLPFIKITPYLAPIILYALLDTIFAFQAAIRGKNPAYFPILFFIFPITHISYALGMVLGFFTFWRTMKPHAQKKDMNIIEINLH
jgi:succinoglycan biosynthesis protein ExoA